MFKTASRNGARLCMGAASRWRNLYYGALGVKLEGYVWMRRIEISRNWSDITLGNHCALDRGVVLLCTGPTKPDKIKIGSDTYINRLTMLDAHNKLWIGSNVMVGPMCYLTDSDHGFEGGNSAKTQPMKPGEIIIEDEVWIGARVCVLKGVRIGRGAVVGAGAVVTKDVPANAIVAGVPARVLRLRE